VCKISSGTPSAPQVQRGGRRRSLFYVLHVHLAHLAYTLLFLCLSLSLLSPTLPPTPPLKLATSRSARAHALPLPFPAPCHCHLRRRLLRPRPTRLAQRVPLARWRPARRRGAVRPRPHARVDPTWKSFFSKTPEPLPAAESGPHRAVVPRGCCPAVPRVVHAVAFAVLLVHPTPVASRIHWWSGTFWPRSRRLSHGLYSYIK
jgi:hypothetical protein